MSLSQSIHINAETRNRKSTSKVEKTLRTGADDFMYYKIKKDKLVGVVDLDGNTLVPIIYDDVSYKANPHFGTHFFLTQKYPYVGAYSPDGKEIIPIDRKYTKLSLCSPCQAGSAECATSGFVYFEVERNGGMIGICDAYGAEVIPPSHKYSSFYIERACDGSPNYQPIDIYFIVAKVGDKFLPLDINGIDKSEYKIPSIDYPHPSFNVKTTYNYFSESLYWPFEFNTGYRSSSQELSRNKQEATSSIVGKQTSSTKDSKYQSYIYTKSGRGQSQNTGQWTDAIGSEECVVQFTDDGISVNGMYQPYVKTSGAWKVYGGTSMGVGGSNTTFYYYVDGNKNMKQVCESSSPYGFDTFVYPMSRNGDPTPMGNNVNNGGYVNSNGTNNNTGTGSAKQPARQFKCAYCNGSGRIERNDNAPASFGQTRANKKCNECGKIYDPTVFNHYHVQCGHCGGTGNAK